MAWCEQFMARVRARDSRMPGVEEVMLEYERLRQGAARAQLGGQLHGTPKAGGVSAGGSAPVSLLEEKLLALQSELSSSYKQQAHSSEAAAELDRMLKQLEDDLRSREREVEALNSVVKERVSKPLDLEAEDGPLAPPYPLRGELPGSYGSC